MYKAVLFDFDGTVFDTGEGITKSVQYALRQQGIEAKTEELGFFVGPPLFDSFKYGFNMTDEQAARAVIDYRVRYKDIGLFESHVYEGVEELLKTLKARGVKLAIATAKPIEMAEALLKKSGLYGYFDVCCGAQENIRGRSKPEIIAEAMERLGISALDKPLMVGDTRFDILGAHDCGIKAVGVEYGYGSLEELKNAGADWIVGTPAEIGDIVLPDNSFKAQ